MLSTAISKEEQVCVVCGKAKNWGAFGLYRSNNKCYYRRACKLCFSDKSLMAYYNKLKISTNEAIVAAFEKYKNKCNSCFGYKSKLLKARRLRRQERMANDPKYKKHQLSYAKMWREKNREIKKAYERTRYRKDCVHRETKKYESREYSRFQNSAFLEDKNKKMIKEGALKNILKKIVKFKRADVLKALKHFIPRKNKK